MTEPLWPIHWPEDMTFTSDEELRQKALAESYAGSTLRMLTLYRVGGYTITVAPASPSCLHRHAPLRLSSSADLRACWCSRGCGCSSAPYVVLDAPVGRIDAVTINGEVLPATSYHVEDENKLVRTDGKRWPSCTGWDFTVTYLNAYPVGIMGAHVGGLLAMEFLKLIRGDKRCRLPDGVQNITRAGITMQIREDMFSGGRTGIREVDAWITQWNPHALASRPGVYSVDTPERSRRLPTGFRGVW